jgi:hypothetical protein
MRRSTDNRAKERENAPRDEDVFTAGKAGEEAEEPEDEDIDDDLLEEDDEELDDDEP